MRRTVYVFADGSETVDYKKAVESNKKFTVKMVEIKKEELMSKEAKEARDKSRELRNKEREIKAINKLYDEMYRIECEA